MSSIIGDTENPGVVKPVEKTSQSHPKPREAPFRTSSWCLVEVFCPEGVEPGLSSRSLWGPNHTRDTEKSWSMSVHVTTSWTQSLKGAKNGKKQKQKATIQHK